MKSYNYTRAQDSATCKCNCRKETNCSCPLPEKCLYFIDQINCLPGKCKIEDGASYSWLQKALVKPLPKLQERGLRNTNRFIQTRMETQQTQYKIHHWFANIDKTPIIQAWWENVQLVHDGKAHHHQKPKVHQQQDGANLKMYSSTFLILHCCLVYEKEKGEYS